MSYSLNTPSLIGLSNLSQQTHVQEDFSKRAMHAQTIHACESLFHITNASRFKLVKIINMGLKDLAFHTRRHDIDSVS